MFLKSRCDVWATEDRLTYMRIETERLALGLQYFELNPLA